MTIFHHITKAAYRRSEWRQAFGGASVAILLTASGATAADLAYKAPPSVASALYDWTGFYAGVTTGYAFGSSNWTARSGGAVVDHGSLNLSQGYDGSNQGGSWFNGVELGYNRMLANRVVIGVEADVNSSSFQNYRGNRIGNTLSLVNAGGAETYSDNVFVSGTVRGRIGYAPGNWLFYATGGFAWTHEQFQLASAGGTDSAFQQRVGWAAGVGLEGPLAPHWTAKAEYLYTGFGNRDITFPSAGQTFTSNLNEQQVRVGVNYHFGEKDPPSYASNYGFDPDKVNIHGQVTYVWQGYPAFSQKSISGFTLAGPVPPLVTGVVPPFVGLNNGGQGRSVGDATLYLGYRLWSGAEFWINPEIDQGSGIGNNLGVGAYPNAEAFKVGSSQPYAKIQRAFVRQTINLGGETQDVAADINQFAGKQTADRLVFTFGRLSPLDVFDTNKFANNAKTQFFNWGFLYGLPFDWGGDAWGYGWGATAEWYQGRFTYRLGYFDTEKSAIADNNPPPLPVTPDFGVDPTFRQYNIISEIEERHELWGQPGKFKLNVNVIGANLGRYTDAIADALAQSACSVNTNFGANAPALSCVRKYTTKVDFHINIEQNITPDIGVFSRIGMAPGYVEDLAVTDGNLFISGGASFSGNLWGRSADTIGVGYIYNKISEKERQYLNFGGPGSPLIQQQLPLPSGGAGSFIGDGQLANLRAEQVLEAYYSWQLTPSTAITADYQFLANPGFNGDRGPVNIFAARVHSQF
jgi:high affinity Mn2+ porin